jgi:DNA-binding NarL/FixJ family response regulator
MRVLIVDDQLAFADSLSRFLVTQDGIEDVEIAGGINEGLALARRHPPSVVLMEYRSDPGAGADGGAHALRKIQLEFPDTRVVVLTGQDESFLHEALREGASGWVSKTQRLADIVDALRSASDGRVSINHPARGPNGHHANGNGNGNGAAILTKREMEILTRLAVGMRTHEMASEVYLSEHTVRNHIRHILKKLDAHSRLEAVAKAQNQGLLKKR